MLIRPHVFHQSILVSFASFSSRNSSFVPVDQVTLPFFAFLDLLGTTIEAEGDWDARGTLAVDKTAAVGKAKVNSCALAQTTHVFFQSSQV